jgi:hypothetical protein
VQVVVGQSRQHGDGHPPEGALAEGVVVQFTDDDNRPLVQVIAEPRGHGYFFQLEPGQWREDDPLPSFEVSLDEREQRLVIFVVPPTPSTPVDLTP